MEETKTKQSKKSVKKTKIDYDAMEKHQKMIEFLDNILNNVELELKRSKIILAKLSKFDASNVNSLESDQETDIILNEDLQSYEEDNTQIVEWYFDWYFMFWADQKKYPVPMNYSSKTKLVPWDKLKLKILEDGKFVYKLIQPTERKHIKAKLSKTDDNKFIAITDEWNSYFLNQAAITFFKWKPWDELYIVINAKKEENFAAIEAIIKK